MKGFIQTCTSSISRVNKLVFLESPNFRKLSRPPKKQRNIVDLILKQVLPKVSFAHNYTAVEARETWEVGEHIHLHWNHFSRHLLKALANMRATYRTYIESVLVARPMGDLRLQRALQLFSYGALGGRVTRKTMAPRHSPAQLSAHGGLHNTFRAV